MEDVQTRLKEATENCLKCHQAWVQDKKNAQTREKIMEAVHELRKVAARLEIDIAVSERDQMASNPIPIPSHRASKHRHNNKNSDDNNNVGNKNDEAQQRPAPRKLPPRKKAASKPSE